MMAYLGLALVFLAGWLAGSGYYRTRYLVTREANKKLAERLARRHLEQAMVDDMRARLVAQLANAQLAKLSGTREVER